MKGKIHSLVTMPPEKANELPIDKAPDATPEQLVTSIREGIDKKDEQGVLQAIVDVATNGKGSLPERPFGDMLKSLGSEGQEWLKTVLSKTEKTSVVTSLQSLMNDVMKTDAPTLLGSTTAGTIVGKISEFVSKNIGPTLDAKAKSLGMKEGSATKWMTKFFTGTAEKVLLSIAFSLKSLTGDGGSILETSAALAAHRLGLNETDSKKYIAGYLKAAENIDSAKAFKAPKNLQAALDALNPPLVKKPETLVAKNDEKKIEEKKAASA